MAILYRTYQLQNSLKRKHIIDELRTFGVVDVDHLDYDTLLGKLSAKRAARE